MNCKRIRPKLDLLAGDDLSGRDAAEVEGHLRQCLSCYREYVELREMVVAVRGASRPPEFARSRSESESFVGDVMKQIQGPPPALPRLIPRLTMVSGWAAALVLGLTAGWYQRQSSRPVWSPPGARPIIENQNPSLPTIESDLKRQIDELRGRTPEGPVRRVDDVKGVRPWPPKSF
jgi:anti-sigma factor RsiW